MAWISRDNLDPSKLVRSLPISRLTNRFGSLDRPPSGYQTRRSSESTQKKRSICHLGGSNLLLVQWGRLCLSSHNGRWSHYVLGRLLHPTSLYYIPAPLKHRELKDIHVSEQSETHGLHNGCICTSGPFVYCPLRV
jgi:hypothetical protein